MWSLGVVFDSPPLDRVPCVGERLEPLEIQALVPQSSLETFDKSILHGPARVDVGDLDVSLICPGMDGLARKLGAVVYT